MHRIAWLALLPLAACVGQPSTGLPAFPRFRDAGTNRILLTALGQGHLARRGRCLGIGAASGRRFRTVVWPETAELSLDEHGLLVTDRASGARVRLGDPIRFGGGQLPPGAAAALAPELTEPVLPECAASLTTINPGFRAVG